MACVARITGGKLYDAQTPAELAKAISDALMAASQASGTVAPPPRAGDARAAAVKPGLYLTTVLSAGGETARRAGALASRGTGDGNVIYQGENTELVPLRLAQRALRYRGAMGPRLCHADGQRGHVGDSSRST